MDLAEKQLTALNQLIGVVASSNSFYKAKLEACQLDGFESLEAFSEKCRSPKAEIAEDHRSNPPTERIYLTRLKVYTYPSNQWNDRTAIAWLVLRKAGAGCSRWKIIWKLVSQGRGCRYVSIFLRPLSWVLVGFEAAAQMGIRCIPAVGRLACNACRC